MRTPRPGATALSSAPMPYTTRPTREAALAAVAVGQLAAGDHQRRHDEQEERDRDLDALHGGVEVLADVVDHHVHVRAGEAADELGQGERDEDPAQRRVDGFPAVAVSATPHPPDCVSCDVLPPERVETSRSVAMTRDASTRIGRTRVRHGRAGPVRMAAWQTTHGPTTSSSTGPRVSWGGCSPATSPTRPARDAHRPGRALAGAVRRGAGRTSGGGPGLGRARGRCGRPAGLARSPVRPGSWPRRSGPTPGTGFRWSRPARAPARTTPTSPARCCSCGTPSTASTPWPGRRARASSTPAATTRSRRTSPLLLARRARADGAGGLRDVRLVASLKGGFSGGTIDSMRAPARGAARGPRTAAGSSRPVRPQPRPGRRTRHRAAPGRRPARRDAPTAGGRRRS